MSFTPQRIEELRAAFPKAASLIRRDSHVAELADFVQRISSKMGDISMVDFKDELERRFVGGIDFEQLMNVYGYNGVCNGETLQNKIAQMVNETKVVIEEEDVYVSGALRDRDVIYAPYKPFSGTTQQNTFGTSTLLGIQQKATPLTQVESGGVVVTIGGVNYRVDDDGRGKNYCTIKGVPYRIDGITFKGLNKVGSLFNGASGLVNQTLVVDGENFTAMDSAFGNAKIHRLIFSDQCKPQSWSQCFYYYGGPIVENINFQIDKTTLQGIASWTFNGAAAITSLSFNSDCVIYLPFGSSSGYGGGGVIPQNLDVPSIKDYISHLYDWETDADNMRNVVYNGHTLQWWLDNGADGYTFNGMTTRVLALKMTFSTNECRLLVEDWENSDRTGVNYIKMIKDKGWQPLSATYSPAAPYEI